MARMTPPAATSYHGRRAVMRTCCPQGALYAVVLAVGVVAAVVSTAWACVPQPLVTLAPSARGPAGSQVTVNGYALKNPAEIRWNAVDGPLLGEAQGPVFSVPVRVPAVKEGLYVVVVLEREPNGALGSTTQASFEVTAKRRSSVGGLRSGTGSSLKSQGSSESVSQGTAILGGAGLVAGGTIFGVVLAIWVPRRRANRGDGGSTRHV